MWQNVFPAGTWRLYNGALMSMQCHDDTVTLMWRCINVRYRLGSLPVRIAETLISLRSSADYIQSRHIRFLDKFYGISCFSVRTCKTWIRRCLPWLLGTFLNVPFSFHLNMRKYTEENARQLRLHSAFVSGQSILCVQVYSDILEKRVPFKRALGSYALQTTLLPYEESQQNRDCN